MITPETRAELLRLCEAVSRRSKSWHLTLDGQAEWSRFGIAARGAVPDLIAENERLTANQAVAGQPGSETYRSMKVRVNTLEAENERLREALEYIASEDRLAELHASEGMLAPYSLLQLFANRAREALAGTPAEKPENTK